MALHSFRDVLAQRQKKKQDCMAVRTTWFWLSESRPPNHYNVCTWTEVWSLCLRDVPEILHLLPTFTCSILTHDYFHRRYYLHDYWRRHERGVRCTMGTSFDMIYYFLEEIINYYFGLPLEAFESLTYLNARSFKWKVQINVSIWETTHLPSPDPTVTITCYRSNFVGTGEG